MSKARSKPGKTPVRTASTGAPGLLNRHPHGVYLTVLAVLLIIFFHDAFFSGKVFNVPDNVSSIQYEQGYLEKAKHDGVNAFWNPYIFSGMPTWGSSSPGHGMYLHTFLDPLKPMLLLQIYGIVQSAVGIFPLPDAFWNVFNFFLLGLFTYMFGIRRKFEPFAAFLVAVSVVFTLYSLNWIMGGHNTKITVFAWLPATLLLIDMLFEKKSPLFIALLIAAMHFTFNSGHVQMIFYNLFAVTLYVIFKWYEGEKPGNVLIVGAIMLGAAAFAFLMLSGPYFATWEYKDFSIRGAGSGGSGHGPAGGGLDYDYATNWSFSPIEVLTFFVPSFVGFGTPTYWGTMPFTESPIYLGVVACTLAIIGILLQPKNRFVHFWVVLGLIALLISFGRNFGVLYDLLFNHLPFFNNFRIPSMILYLEGLCIAMLAGVGLSTIITRTRSRARGDGFERALTKAVWIPAAAAAVLILVLLVSGDGFKSMITADMQKYQPQSWNLVQQVEQAAAQGQMARVPEEYQQATVGGIYDMAVHDALVALTFMVLTGAIVWGFARGKIPFALLQIGLFAALVIDLWIVDYKPMKMEPKRAQEQVLEKTDVVDFLEKDASLYRILPVSAHGGDNYYVAFGIQSIAGYHPAKLKYYDDIRNTVFNQFQFTSADQIDGADWPLLSMLNTKYVVVPSGIALRAPWLRRVFQGRQEDVFENMNVLPRAFFVGAHQVIASDSAMFRTIGAAAGYEPNRVAYLSAPPERPVPQVADSVIARATATVTAFGLNGMTIEAQTPVDAILKLSEVYYPSGWTATIDGRPAPILRSDYLLRALVVPAGRHTIVLSFQPRTYTAGLVVTVITNYLLTAVLILYLLRWARARFGGKPKPAAPAAQ